MILKPSCVPWSIQDSVSTSWPGVQELHDLVRDLFSLHRLFLSPSVPLWRHLFPGAQLFCSGFLLISLPETPSGIRRMRLSKLSTSASTLCSSVTLFLIAQVGSTPSFWPPLCPGKPLPNTEAFLCPYSWASLSWEAASPSATGAPSK